MYSWRGVGKTHFAMGIATAGASGGSFLRWEAPRKRRVLLVDGEMAQEDVQAWLDMASRSISQPVESMQLRLLPAAAQDGHMPNLNTATGQEAIEELLEPGDVLILDNEACLSRYRARFATRILGAQSRGSTVGSSGCAIEA